MSETDGSMSKPQKPAPKKAGRKKVAKKNLARRPKRRGTHSTSGNLNLAKELAECIFSDEEVRQEYLEANPAIEDFAQSSISLASSDGAPTDCSALESPASASSSSLSTCTHSDTSSVSLSNYDSRPSSSLSRPDSTESRPQSSATSRLMSTDSRPPLTFPRPISTDYEAPSAESKLDSNPQEEIVARVENVEIVPESVNPNVDLIVKGLDRLKTFILIPWIVIADTTGFHFLQVSSKFPRAIQKEVFVSFSGNVLISVHCALLPNFKELFGLEAGPSVVFIEERFNEYCKFCVELIKKFRMYSVCVGANDESCKEVWSELSETYIDHNPYKEESYTETCRSVFCTRLIKFGKGFKRCKKCAAVMKTCQKRREFLLSPAAAPHTSNKYLTKQQALTKLEAQQEEIRKKAKQIAYLRQRYRDILEVEGCNVDEDLNDFFSNVLSSSNLSQHQQMFLNEQWSCSSKADSRAHRWHPSMIRFALHLHMVSSSGYEALRDSGIIKLPCARTLFDYSHAIAAKNGINEGLVELVHKSVQKFPEGYKHYHVLLCDGMHISQNLVFRGVDGSLVGFTHFDDVDKEMERLDNYVQGKQPIPNEPQLATEMLAYMVKGLASDVKCTIAAYPCKILTKEVLYKRTWEVINICEKSGIKILMFVCDGYAVNRAFIAMHSPLTTLPSRIIFDTLNFCSVDERPLYFCSDVCHLLKTVRNCFYNSGEGEKKKRLLQVNGEKIVWGTIVKLYMTFKGDNFRKSFKLNAQNVFPNPFARMRVRYAAQVLSNTVSEDLKAQNWEGTKETVRFIKLCDKFFDVLNGAHSSQGKRQRKADLEPYTSIDDPRFQWLEHTFLKYLQDWKDQVNSLPIDATSKDRMMLSHQTLTGIEITIRSFIAATKYFLNPEEIGGKFLMARVFSQDPLEQHFSRQRCGGGGSRNPNAARFQSKMVSVALQRDLGVRHKRGNVTEEGNAGMTLSEEPLPKRKRTTKKKTD